jgi:hypothetical protein
MKKLLLVLVSLTLLPTLTSYGLTNNEKLALGGLGVLVVGGTIYYIRSDSSTQAPQEISDQPNTSEKDQNQQPKEEVVRHQKVYGTSKEQLETQRRLQEFIANEAEAFKKQEELKKEPAAQQNNKPTQPILSPGTPNTKPNVNNPSPLNKPIDAVTNTTPAAKEENPSYSSYCERVSEIGWDY